MCRTAKKDTINAKNPKEMIDFNEEKQDKKISDLHRAEEEGLAKLLSQKYGIPYTDLSATYINTDALRLIKEPEARNRKVAAFDIVGKRVALAVQSPQTGGVEAAVKDLAERGYKPELYMVSTKSLERAWERYGEVSYASETPAGVLDISSEEIEKVIAETKNLSDVKERVNETLRLDKSHRVSRIVEVFLAGAMALGASDVHTEPEEEAVRLRLRLDGILVDVVDFDLETYKLLLSRIKLLSDLKLNIKENAQDGRFSIKRGKGEIEIRTSILPGNYGESIVLRILNPDTISVPIEELGIEPKLLARLEKEIARPNGMILTTGPTGSGKTTTLYAFMRKINKPEVKIITIENPIEYHLPGIVQTQTEAEKGYTFSQGLRSALRQDPDVIMVGEIRDGETATIAVNASLTGHLVFSTLHTNDAAGTFPRLMDLGIDPKILSSAVNVSIAQRLVRKLCPACRKETSTNEEQKILINKILSGVKDKSYAEDLSAEKMWLAGEGCERCNGGYKGRVGVFEAIFMNEKIEGVIRTNPSGREIKSAAEEQGFLDMKEDGVIKTLKGITTLSELERVVDLKE